jgi:hypothetical protein
MQSEVNGPMPINTAYTFGTSLVMSVAEDPAAVLGVVKVPAIEPVAREARERLLRVIASLEAESK